MSRSTLLLTHGIRRRIQTQRHIFRRHLQRRDEVFQSCQFISRVTIPPVANHRGARSFSDNLLGHSPMARPAIANKNITPQPQSPSPLNPGKSGPLWGVDSNTEGGGVWAQTSSKREKLTELRGEITEGKESLDDMATVEERKELHFADGLTLVVRAVDEAWDVTTTTTNDEEGMERSIVAMVEKWLGETETDGVTVDRSAFEAHLFQVESRIDQYLDSERQPSPLSLLSEFIYDDDDQKAQSSPSSQQQQVQSAFTSCILLYKLLLVKHTAATLRSSWDVITRLTDADVDRAAVEGIDATPPTTLPLAKINAILRASSTSTCRDRFDAYWHLMDDDDDGRLDQKKMDDVVLLSLKPTEMALVDFATRAISAVDFDEDAAMGEGWRRRRRRDKIKRRLTKMMVGAAGRHFEDEVETPHRLRCIYAWAEKRHQDGKVDSVLVDTGAGDDVGGAIMGRKRYVELDPLISLEEFRSVQGWHFGQLDRVGEEIVRGFRDDLLVHQGKGRQYSELKRDCALFFTVVTLIDLGIVYM